MISTTIYQITAEDLERFFNDKLSKEAICSFLNRYEKILVTVDDIARFHNVHPNTVYNYINDGLIIPEIRGKDFKDSYRFRMSYALLLDFKDLRKQLHFKNKQLKIS
ncbi:helix-turn-helix domain-containing protein [Dysgonomonas sp. Marseille-P4677]|uniref:helix-turn-helix domain-containing protein n=1 Tax=Dysgonomonas sp. Marseille-P4677 TaxID=2364790 RepID=UPI001913ABC1|nr:helix-turn-helix domain-containing protein [Dysgonomonas sp. Marseille-P4677]MBK5721389.1 helix-turn-helix domain-containing protein [Dysgonomonas sp. Marseille-P4677]